MKHRSPVPWGLAATLLLTLSSGGRAQQPADVTTTSLVSGGTVVAAGSLAVSRGTRFTTQTAAATQLPLPTTLAGLRVNVADVGDARANASLYMASPDQVNFLVPEDAAPGLGTVSLMGSTSKSGDIFISNVAPALITLDLTATGMAAGQSLTVGAGDPQTGETLDSIDLGEEGAEVYLILYGTGIRNHSPNPVIALVDGEKVPVLYAGAQSEFAGLDQVNIGPLPRSLANSGVVDVELFVDGAPANVVTVTIQ